MIGKMGSYRREHRLPVTDEDFPSGHWTGFFNYFNFPGKWRTDLRLDFIKGRMTGDGVDSVGPFIVAGSYDGVSRECHWTKTYVAAHDVFYTGFREGKGIWGTWEITENGTSLRGGFQIWPVGSEEGDYSAIEAEQILPAEIVQVGCYEEASVAEHQPPL